MTTKSENSAASSLAAKIAARLKAIREKEGIGIEKFANKHQMTASQWGRYERAETNFRIDTLERILEIVKMTPQEFFSEGF